jgi:dihydroneopterin aldolase
MDTIRLDGVRIMGRHGVFAEERTREQPFVVDVALHCDVRAAGTSDDLRLTIDYGAVAFVIRDVIEGESVQLIETLAERIAARVLATTAVQVVWVRVAKPDAPITVPFTNVAVEITRRRS